MLPREAAEARKMVQQALEVRPLPILPVATAAIFPQKKRPFNVKSAALRTFFVSEIRMF